jgi:hypothetical protein
MFYRLKLDSKVVQANQEDTAKRKRDRERKYKNS